MAQEIAMQSENNAIEPKTGSMAFSFGEPEGVLNGRDIWGLAELYHNGQYYEPPLPLTQLAKTFNMAVHHRSAIQIKVNLLKKHFVPTRYLDAKNFEKFILNYLQMANGYLERIPNMAGGVLRLESSPASHTRVGVEEGTYFFIRNQLGRINDHKFALGSIFHMFQPDVAQEVYGIPEWLAALQSGLLNENTTLYHRRYYVNGAHSGSIFYMTDQFADKETADDIKDRMQKAKGVGNFRNLFLYIPGGKKDGLQVMPIAAAMTKDEFANIKNVTRDDMLAAHRVPPQLIGIIPQNNGGFGDVGRATDVFFANEIVPIMNETLAVNAWLGVEAVRYRPYEQQANPAPAAAR